MAAELLRRHGYGANALPNATLDTGNLDRLGAAPAQLCCLSVLEEGSSATSLRFMLRRLRRRLPDTRLAIGLWQARAGSPTLAALRSEGQGEPLVTSLREALALCRALTASEPAAAEAPRLAPNTARNTA
jgi:hypothetical protein